MAIIRKQLVVGPLQCNCAILACEKTKEAVIIDPGDEAERILKEVASGGYSVKWILHTHAHFDHIAATGKVSEALKAPPCLHQADEFLYKMLPMQGKMFGMNFSAAPAIEKFLEDEEILRFGEHRLQVIHTPGHSPGGVCFRLLEEGEDLFSGDTLFQQSIGRTDLWGGDCDLLISSIRRRLFTLDDDTDVHPGHGPSTSIGVEKRSNPFLV